MHIPPHRWDGGGGGSVVGSQAFKYTIMGDTVNVASRMESTSLPCQVRRAKLERNCRTAQSSLFSSQTACSSDLQGAGGSTVSRHDLVDLFLSAVCTAQVCGGNIGPGREEEAGKGMFGVLWVCHITYCRLGEGDWVRRTRRDCQRHARAFLRAVAVPSKTGGL